MQLPLPALAGLVLLLAIRRHSFSSQKAREGIKRMLLWNAVLWLDGIYPTTVLPKCPTSPGSCRTALNAQGAERGTSMMQTHHSVVGMQMASALMQTLGPALTPAHHLCCFAHMVSPDAQEPATTSGLLAL